MTGQHMTISQSEVAAITIQRAHDALDKFSIDSFQRKIFGEIFDNSPIASVEAPKQCFIPVALPIYIAGAMTGSMCGAETLSAALALLEAGIYALDHLMDDELSGPLAQRSKSSVMTAATCFVSYLPHMLIAEIDCDTALHQRLAATLSEGLARIGHGQLLDVAFRIEDMPSPQLVEQCVTDKTGARRGLYARMAAELAGASAVTTEAYTVFGTSLGVARQLNSDIKDIFTAQTSRDIASGACTLPFAFYFASAAPAEAVRMHALINGARYDPAALPVVRTWLRESGALRNTLVRKEIFCIRALDSLSVASRRGPANDFMAEAISEVSWRKYAPA
jgi:hypothetical protein